jgi:TonB family protein
MTRVLFSAAFLLLLAPALLPASGEALADLRGPDRCAKVDSTSAEHEGVTPPSLLLQVPPTYPLNATIDEDVGTVIIEFTVSEKGKVADPKIICAHPRRRFEKAAIAALKKWEYQPATQDGKPVAFAGMRTKFTFDFTTKFP